MRKLRLREDNHFSQRHTANMSPNWHFYLNHLTLTQTFEFRAHLLTVPSTWDILVCFFLGFELTLLPQLSNAIRTHSYFFSTYYVLHISFQLPIPVSLSEASAGFQNPLCLCSGQTGHIGDECLLCSLEQPLASDFREMVYKYPSSFAP